MLSILLICVTFSLAGYLGITKVAKREILKIVESIFPWTKTTPQVTLWVE